MLVLFVHPHKPNYSIKEASVDFNWASGSPVMFYYDRLSKYCFFPNISMCRSRSLDFNNVCEFIIYADVNTLAIKDVMTGLKGTWG